MDKTVIYSIYTVQSTFPYLFHLTRKASENYEITTGPQAVLRHSTLRRCTSVPGWHTERGAGGTTLMVDESNVSHYIGVRSDRLCSGV